MSRAAASTRTRARLRRATPSRRRPGPRCGSLLAASYAADVEVRAHVLAVGPVGVARAVVEAEKRLALQRLRRPLADVDGLQVLEAAGAQIGALVLQVLVEPALHVDAGQVLAVAAR